MHYGWEVVGVAGILKLVQGEISSRKSAFRVAVGKIEWTPLERQKFHARFLDRALHPAYVYNKELPFIDRSMLLRGRK